MLSAHSATNTNKLDPTTKAAQQNTIVIVGVFLKVISFFLVIVLKLALK